MATTPKLTIIELETNADGTTVFNAAVRELEQWAGTIVADSFITTQPGSPAEGDLHFINGTGSGAEWTGNNNVLAYFVNGAWAFQAPLEGWIVYDANTNRYFRWDTSAMLRLFERQLETNIQSVTASEDVVMTHTAVELVIEEISTIVRGASSPDVTWTVRYGTDRSAAGTEVITGGHTTSATTTHDSQTTFNNGTVPAGNFVWLETSAVTGTVDEFHISVKCRHGDI